MKTPPHPGETSDSAEAPGVHELRDSAEASWKSACGELRLAAERPSFERLWRFLTLTLETARVHNITGVHEPLEAWDVLVLQSLAFMPALLARMPAVPEAAAAPPRRVADVGSGAGVPGVPIALSWPQSSGRIWLTAIECRHKKADILAALGSELGLVLDVYAERAEDVGRMPEAREQFDAVVVRALGSLAEVLEYGLPLVRVGGTVFIAKSLAQIDEELPAGRVAAECLGGGDPLVDLVKVAGRTTALVSVTKNSPTPKAFPRRAGLPRAEPLGGKPRK